MEKVRGKLGKIEGRVRKVVGRVEKVRGKMGRVGEWWKKSGTVGKVKGKGGCHKFSFTFQIFFAFVHPGLDRQTLIQDFFIL